MSIIIPDGFISFGNTACYSMYIPNLRLINERTILRALRVDIDGDTSFNNHNMESNLNNSGYMASNLTFQTAVNQCYSKRLFNHLPKCRWSLWR